MVNGNHFSSKLLLLGVALATSLLLTLVQPAQAREEADILTIQAAKPKTPTVGQPFTFNVIVNNNAVAQQVGVEDFLPPEASLVSATPSQGTCAIRHDSTIGRDVVGCAFGVVRSGGTAEVEIVVTPTTPGAMTNTAVATAEFSPASPAHSSTATVTVEPVAGSGT